VTGLGFCLFGAGLDTAVPKTQSTTQIPKGVNINSHDLGPVSALIKH
jgi:hypothetical protein